MSVAIIDGDVLVYMSIWKSETKEEALSKFEELFQENCEAVFATDYVMALGGPDNFRLDLYEDYKGNRTKAKSSRPDWFLDLKSDIEAKYDGCVFSENCEADDLVRVWANECAKLNVPHVVVTVDKDLDCIIGNHYNPRKGEFYVVDQEYATRFYWKQVLMGDSTDNIPGIPKVGPVKADKILDNGSDFKTSVCKAYYDYYGDRGYEYMIANGRLIHIWRTLNDHFKIKRSFYDDAVKE